MWVQTTNKVPKTHLCPGTLEALDEEQGITRKPLTRAERQARVLKELNVEALNKCGQKNWCNMCEISSKNTMMYFH